MHWDTLELKIQSIACGELPRFTMVLGAGIHQMGSVGPNPLASWPELLDAVSGKTLGNFENVSPSLCWELLSMSSKIREQLAHEGERDFRALLREKIRTLEPEAINQGRKAMEPIFEILDSGKVSDVISLNLDLVLERLYAARHGCNLKVHGKGRLNRFRDIESRDGNSVRFWHPHGDTDSLGTMMMGMWEYQKQLPQLRRRFNQLKSRERLSESKNHVLDNSRSGMAWLDSMIYQPVIFAGTSLDSAEWDLWFSILMRWRNRGRSENPFAEMWRLSQGDDDSSILTKDLSKGAIAPLHGEGWNESWAKLVNLMKH